MDKGRHKSKCNAPNERAKYRYRIHLRRIGQRDEKTVFAALKYLRDYEVFTDFAGFEKFNDTAADEYIRGMFQRGLSLSYISDNIRALKDFLKWLERQRGYRSKINYNHIEYLNISRNQRNAAKASAYQKAYKFDQVVAMIRIMPEATDRERRDKAMISLQALCTLRISELRTVKIKNLIEEDGVYFIHVSPKNMSVKFAKTRHAVFVPLPADIQANVTLWRDRLLSLGFGENDPLFPIVDSRFNVLNLLEQTVKKRLIASDTTIRAIFKKAFALAGLAYINPHSFRKTLARFAQTQSPAFLNAVRQNLGHSSIDTTLNSYGQLSQVEQRQIIASARFSEP